MKPRAAKTPRTYVGARRWTHGLSDGEMLLALRWAKNRRYDVAINATEFRSWPGIGRKRLVAGIRARNSQLGEPEIAIGRLAELLDPHCSPTGGEVVELIELVRSGGGLRDMLMARPDEWEGTVSELWLVDEETKARIC